MLWTSPILGRGSVAMRPAAELHYAKGEGGRGATAGTPAVTPVLDHARKRTCVIVSHWQAHCVIFSLVKDRPRNSRLKQRVDHSCSTQEVSSVYTGQIVVAARRARGWGGGRGAKRGQA